MDTRSGVRKWIPKYMVYILDELLNAYKLGIIKER